MHASSIAYYWTMSPDNNFNTGSLSAYQSVGVPRIAYTASYKAKLCRAPSLVDWPLVWNGDISCRGETEREEGDSPELLSCLSDPHRRVLGGLGSVCACCMCVPVTDPSELVNSFWCGLCIGMVRDCCLHCSSKQDFLCGRAMNNIVDDLLS